jgi:hypothetical protein
MTTPWHEWKKKNSARQATGEVSPLDFLNPDTDYSSNELAENRWKTCKECPHLMVTAQCAKCMCLMPAKVRLKNATCPEGKW